MFAEQCLSVWPRLNCYDSQMASNATLIDISLLPQQQNSIATSPTMDCCCLKGSVHQIRSSYTFKQQSYKCYLGYYGNKASIAKVIRWIEIVSKDLCSKLGVHIPLNSKVISTCLCCHGNEISIETSNTIDCHCLMIYVYQV